MGGRATGKSPERRKAARGEGKWKRGLGPDPSTQQHACTRVDKALWVQHAHDDFAADMNHCAPLCMGNTNCVARCAARRQPELSKACTREYGLLANCGVTSCWWPCLAIKKDRCEACFHKHCNPSFFNRTGLDNDGPLEPVQVDHETNASTSSMAYAALLCVLVLVMGLPRFRRALRLDSERKAR
jgi:hypothetical protein